MQFVPKFINVEYGYGVGVKDGEFWRQVPGEDRMSYLEAEEVVGHFKAEGDGETYGVIDAMRVPVPRPPKNVRRLLEVYEVKVKSVVAEDTWNRELFSRLCALPGVVMKTDEVALVDLRPEMMADVDSDTEPVLFNMLLAAYMAGADQLLVHFRKDWWSEDAKTKNQS